MRLCAGLLAILGIKLSAFYFIGLLIVLGLPGSAAGLTPQTGKPALRCAGFCFLDGNGADSLLRRHELQLGGRGQHVGAVIPGRDAVMLQVLVRCRPSDS